MANRTELEKKVRRAQLEERVRHAQAQEVNEMSMPAAAAEAGAQGLSLGSIDELRASAGASGEAVEPWLREAGITNPSVMALAQTVAGLMDIGNPKYDTSSQLTEERDKIKEARLSHPLVSGAAEMGGVALNPLSYLSPGTGAGILAKLGTYAIPGAIYGAMGSEREGTDQLSDAALGGLVSGLGGLAGDKITSFIKRLPALRNRKGLAALGASAKDIALDEKRGFNVGQAALDRDLLPLGQSTDDMLGRAQQVLDEGKEAMGRVFTEADATGQKAVDPLAMAIKVEEELGPEYKTPFNKDVRAYLENAIETILERRGAQTLKSGQGIEREFSKVAYPRGQRPLSPTPKQTAAQQAEMIVSRYLNDAAENVLGPTADLQAAKRTYQVGRTASDLLQHKVATESAHTLRFSDLWNMPISMVAGPKMQARLLNSSVVKFMLEKMPQGLGKFLGPVSEAYQAGPAALEALHQNLATDPEYQYLTSTIQSEVANNPMARTALRQSIQNDASLDASEKARQLSQLNSGGF